MSFYKNERGCAVQKKYPTLFNYSSELDNLFTTQFTNISEYFNIYQNIVVGATEYQNAPIYQNISKIYIY